MDKVLGRLGSDRRASVAPMVGLTLFALVGAGGIAFDYARMAALDTELQSAADQAALAGASQLDGEDQTCERAVAAARNLLANKSVMANEVASRNVTIADSTVCRSDATIVDDTTATIRFFKDKAATIPALTDSEAHFIEVTVDAPDDGEGGLLLFYNHKAFVGLGFAREAVKNFQYAEEHPWARVPRKTGGPVRVRLTNDAHVLTWHYSFDGGKTWQLHPTRMEVSGIHQNVFGGFLSLRPGLYASGNGTVRFRDFRYRALDGAGA